MADKKTKLLQLRIHPTLREQLEKLVKRNVSNITTEVTIAIRKHLRDEGLWPPSREKAEGDSGEPGTQR